MGLDMYKNNLPISPLSLYMGHFTLFILCHIQIPPWKKARVGHEQQRMKHCFKTTRSVPRTHKLGPFSLVGTEYLWEQSLFLMPQEKAS